MSLILPRRRFIAGLAAAFAAPAIVRAESLMPIKAVRPEILKVTTLGWPDQRVTTFHFFGVANSMTGAQDFFATPEISPKAPAGFDIVYRVGAMRGR